jgi:transposase
MELVHAYNGGAMTEGFEVLPLPVEAPVEAKPKRKRKAKVVVVPKGKRSPGRPRLYNGTHRRMVAAALKKHGYTKGLEFLKVERNLKVSLTLARSVAKELGLTFTRGRPKAA